MFCPARYLLQNTPPQYYAINLYLQTGYRYTFILEAFSIRRRHEGSPHLQSTFKNFLVMDISENVVVVFHRRWGTSNRINAYALETVNALEHILQLNTDAIIVGEYNASWLVKFALWVLLENAVMHYRCQIANSVILFGWWQNALTTCDGLHME